MLLHRSTRLSAALLASLVGTVTPLAATQAVLPAAVVTDGGAGDTASTNAGATNAGAGDDAFDSFDDPDKDPNVGAVPHSPKNRVPQPVSVERRGAAVVSRVDLGDLQVGPARMPVRATLVTPASTAGTAELVVFSHLRYPNCSGNQFGYPCPPGSTRCAPTRA